MNNLLEKAQQGTPVIEGDQVTLVWQGKAAPQLIGDFTDWDWGKPVTLHQVSPEVWACSLTFPSDAYIEYSFWRNKERIADPLNPLTTPDGLGHNNHYFYMPDASPTSLIRRRRNVPHGLVKRFTIEHDIFLVGRKRPVYLYQPLTTEPIPLLVVLDGQDYRRRAKLTNIVDNLIFQKRMQPVALAMIHHGAQARGIEYAASEAHLAVLLYQLLPLAKAELNLLDIQSNPGAFGIMGASMGGLQALHAGLRAPHVFGHLLCQSGSFSINDHNFVVWDLIQQLPVQPIKIWMDVGRYEWLLDCNQRMHARLVDKGYDVEYREHSGGHNYPSWRNALWRGLEFLFGR